MSKKIYYGWYVTFASGLGIAFSIAVFISSTIGLLAAPLAKEFGWALKDIFIGPMVAVTATILVAPFIGALCDRFGPRKVIAFSFTAQALIMASFYFMDDNIVLFFVRYALLALLGTGATAVSFAGVISRWFDKRRGLALGLALAGVGIGGVLWSLMTQWLFDQYGWRASFLYMAAFVAFVILPIVMVVVRESPASMGLALDGDESSSRTQAAPTWGLTLREAGATGQFWLMLLTVFMVGFGVVSAMQHIVPIVTASGSSGQSAAMVQAAMWGAVVVGRLATGWLMDHIFAPHVAIAFLLPSLLGIGMLSAGVTGPYAFIAAMLIGLAAGAEVDVIAYLTGRYFGIKHYSAIYGTFFSAYALGSGYGPAFTAWLVDKLGSYAQALWVPGGALALAAICLLYFRRFAPSASDKAPVASAIRARPSGGR